MENYISYLSYVSWLLFTVALTYSCIAAINVYLSRNEGYHRVPILLLDHPLIIAVNVLIPSFGWAIVVLILYIFNLEDAQISDD